MATVKQREFNDNKELMMDLHDVAGAFYCLGIGCAAALLTLLLETFYHGCLQHFKSNMARGLVESSYRKCIRRNRIAPHPVHFIQVRSLVLMSVFLYSTFSCCCLKLGVVFSTPVPEL